MTISPDVIAFPGQGEQEKIPETAKFMSAHTIALETLDEADCLIESAIGRRLIAGALSGTADFHDAETIQASIYAVEVAMYRVLEEKGVQPKMVVGHSLGEYAALVAAKAITFEEGMGLVLLRAQAMMQADQETPGGGAMAAINKLSENEVVKIAKSERVEVANFNSPQQFVLSGIKEYINVAAEKLGRHARVLDIPYAAHSSYMESAAEKLREIMPYINFRKPTIPVLSNRVETLKLPEQFRHHLPNQLTLGVNWHPQMRHIIHELQYSRFTEVGPGQMLSKLLKRSFGELVSVEPVESILEQA